MRQPFGQHLPFIIVQHLFVLERCVPLMLNGTRLVGRIDNSRAAGMRRTSRNCASSCAVFRRTASLKLQYMTARPVPASPTTARSPLRKINYCNMRTEKRTAAVSCVRCNGVQREHNKKLNNGLPILHKVPPKRDYGRYFCIMAEKGGTSHGGLTEKLSPFFHAQKQEVNAYGR